MRCCVALFLGLSVPQTLGLVPLRTLDRAPATTASTVSANQCSTGVCEESRRRILSTFGAVLGSSLLRDPQPALAAKGEEAKMIMPDIMQGFQDRATKQCLVESLGSRECLVYADEENKLYRGADAQVLLTRFESASRALANVPDMVETKKWSQVRGTLTGPMGELTRTMLQLAELSSPEQLPVLKKAIQTTKTDLFALDAAVERKDGATVLKFHNAATNDLVAFVKAL